MKKGLNNKFLNWYLRNYCQILVTVKTKCKSNKEAKYNTIELFREIKWHLRENSVF
jgi:hypothetical protein